VNTGAGLSLFDNELQVNRGQLEFKDQAPNLTRPLI